MSETNKTKKTEETKTEQGFFSKLGTKLDEGVTWVKNNPGKTILGVLAIGFAGKKLYDGYQEKATKDDDWVPAE